MGRPVNESRAWLTDWYAAMRDRGHDGSEFLSTIYGGTHSIVAMLAADLGIPGAAEHLQRAVALMALHLTAKLSPPSQPAGPLERLLVMPGCRSVKPRKGLDVAPEGLEQFARYMLGEDHPERPRGQRQDEETLEAAEAFVAGAVALKTGNPMEPTRRRKPTPGRVKAGRELALARRLRARRFVWRGANPASDLARDLLLRLPALASTLATVRSAVGVLIHRQHEHGFVAYFESGPRCYAWPIAAVVCVDGQEPVVVRAPTSKQGKGAGEVEAWREWVEPGVERLNVGKPGAVFSRIDLAPLGALVRETRIEAATQTDPPPVPKGAQRVEWGTKADVILRAKGGSDDGT